MTYSLGVDLGTTTSAAAFRRGARLEVCPLGDLTATMPSATWERPDGSMSVGDEAAAAARFDTALMARHVIARLAHGSPIAVDGRAIDPVRSMQALLATVVDRAQRLYGQAPRETVITHPLVPVEMATVLARAAELTVGPALLVPHPIAAAAKLSRDADLAMGSTVAVLDFGGSSFEVAIVRRTPQGFDLVGAPGGLSDFGGIEIDDMVFARVDAVLGHPSQSIRPDDGEGMAALWRLRAACRAAKERLTTDAEATVDVTLPGTSARVTITRAEFEYDIRPAMTTAIDVAAETIAAAGLRRGDVQVALLVGGSASIPLFGELVIRRLGVAAVADPFPELTVALGAALFGDDGADLGPAEPWPPPGAAGAALTARHDPSRREPAGDAAPGGGADDGDVAALAAWFSDGDDDPGDAGAAYGDHVGTAVGGQLEGTVPGARLTTPPPPTGMLARPAPPPSVPAPPPSEQAGNARRRAGPTTGETDLWGGGGQARRRARARELAALDTPADDLADRAEPDHRSEHHVVLAIIGAALGVVAIAGAALAGNMSAGEAPQVTVADPAVSTVSTTTSSTTTTLSTTTTAEATTTTAPPPPPTTRPRPRPTTTAPPPTTTTAPPTTTTTEATTTTAPPTTTSTTAPTTTSSTMTSSSSPPSSASSSSSRGSSTSTPRGR